MALDPLLTLTREAGRAILDVYARDFTVTIKADDSPVTEADLASNAIITAGLQRLHPQIPILTEEETAPAYEDRRDWPWLWLIDPLDGTKEFVKRTDEFSINIALVQGDRPVLGILYAPAKNLMYFAKTGAGSWKSDGDNAPVAIRARTARPDRHIDVLGSKTHASEQFKAYIAALENQYESMTLTPAGSAFKFGMMAEGLADLYPRFSPTMEWDTAAGQAILEESGKQVLVFETGEPLAYNRPDLVNPPFLCR